MFAAQSIRELKSDLDGIRVAEYIGLHPVRNGKNYWVICPFHKDKHPSMVIYPGSRGYYCQSCGVSGDAIDLYAKVRRVSMKDAVKELSEIFMTGHRPNVVKDNVIDFKDYGAEKAEERERLNYLIPQYRVSKRILQSFKIEQMDDLPEYFWTLVEINSDLENEIDKLIYSKK